MRARTRATGLAVAAVLCGGSALAVTAAAPAARAASNPAPVDVNSASRAQLKTLPGIGDAEAERIIAGRPYRTKADLVIKQTIPEGVFVSIRHRVIAVQTKGSRPQPAASAAQSTPRSAPRKTASDRGSTP